jgi:disulfide bond formation protein DsbB
MPVFFAFKPQSRPVRYAAGTLPVDAFQPYFLMSSLLCAEAKTKSPIGLAMMIWAIVLFVLLRDTSRGLPETMKALRAW